MTGAIRLKPTRRNQPARRFVRQKIDSGIGSPAECIAPGVDQPLDSIQRPADGARSARNLPDPPRAPPRAPPFTHLSASPSPRLSPPHPARARRPQLSLLV